MSKNEKYSKKDIIKPLIIGQIVSIVSTLVIILICAIAVTNLDLGDDWILILALVGMSIGCFIGGMILTKLLQKNGLAMGTLNGFIYFILTTLISFAMNNGAVTIVTLIKLILFVVCSCIGGVIGVNLKSKQKLF